MVRPSALAVGFLGIFVITAIGAIGSLATRSHAAGPTEVDRIPGATAGRAAMIEMPDPPSMRFQDTGILAAPTDIGRAIRASASLQRPAPGHSSASLSKADISVLLARGDSLLGFRDFSAARLFYERAANAGNGQAAVRLGQTYDPSFLEWAQLRFVRGDAAAAAFWYRRARELGVSDAGTLLKGIESK